MCDKKGPIETPPSFNICGIILYWSQVFQAFEELFAALFVARPDPQRSLPPQVQAALPHTFYMFYWPVD
ncbi:MAG: hypothetical protein VB109_22390 [Desulfitobacterium hafniense]|nr:hypothetical protein [Desulfitobacterium hafniense]